jgi:hypothetical protein
VSFFLAHLEREIDLAERIVVFDDPFSSQDGFRRRQTLYEIIRGEWMRPGRRIIPRRQLSAAASAAHVFAPAAFANLA